MFRHLLPVLVLFAASSANAAQRTYSVTSFDHVRVEGSYAVDVHTGASSSARATGDSDALDRLSIEVQGTTLIVRPNKSGWGGWPGAPAGSARIAVSTPSLVSVLLTGPGRVAVDRVRGGDLNLQLMGSGSITVDAIDTDSLTAMLSGSGSLALAGHVRTARLALQGAGRIDGGRLSAADAAVDASGSGDVELEVERSAKVNSAGSGRISIGGSASCLVNQRGTGTIECAHRQVD